MQMYQPGRGSREGRVKLLMALRAAEGLEVVLGRIVGM